MHFHRAYIEITNICGLACSFCPPKNAPSKTMNREFFALILEQLRPLTKELALHVMGDPLSLSNLNTYLDIANQKDFNVMITTSGKYLGAHPHIFHPAVGQINISLNSFNKNTPTCSFEDYMRSIFELCERRDAHRAFINLRLWNLDSLASEESYNQKVFTALEEYFAIKLPHDLHSNPPKFVRLARKIRLHFDRYFEWPSLESAHHSDGFCHGLLGQIAVLADGTVVPCCLDGDGVMDLGNLHVSTLADILNSKRATNIKNSFAKHKAVEDLCQKCSFKERFNAHI